MQYSSRHIMQLDLHVVENVKHLIYFHQFKSDKDFRRLIMNCPITDLWMTFMLM